LTATIIEDKALWDRTVEQSPYGQLFHKWDCLKIAEKHTGSKLLPYGIYNGNELISVFPVFIRKYLGINAVFSPPPQTLIPFLGPTMNAFFNDRKESTRERHLQMVVDEMDAEVKKLRPNYIKVNLAPSLIDIRPFKWNYYSEQSNFTYFLDLNKPIEEVWKNFEKKSKCTIKRANELPLELRQVSDTETFCEVMDRRYAEQGMTFPLAGPQYLKDLLDAFPDNVRMHFVYCKEKLMSVIITSEYKKRMIYWIGNVKASRDIEIDSNGFMLWELIKQAKADGCTEFELHGALVRRLWRIKSKYNPRLEVCYEISKKDSIGTIAEWAYNALGRKKWLLAPGGPGLARQGHWP
jgi:hypothetical protein